MNQEAFDAGYNVDTYIRNLRNYRSFVRGLMDEAAADEEDVAALSAVASRAGVMRATMMSEDWCGDAALNLPILADLFSRAGIELRVVRGSEQAAMKAKYEGEGDDHIPVFSIWDEEWNELARWIEAPAGVDAKKNAWKAEHPEFMELYAKRDSDAVAAKEFAALYRDFMNVMLEWYRDGGWRESTAEVVAAVTSG